MSIARGILSGYLKEGLEQKAARDEMYADMVKETGQEFRKTAQLFRQDEKNIEKRFKIIKADLGTPAALYASYNGLTTSDAGMNLMLTKFNENSELKKQVNEFDFQGYDFSTAKSSRATNFKDQQSDAINLITKNQGSGPVAELFFKDMKSMDTGTQATRPELDLPVLSSSKGVNNDYLSLPVLDKARFFNSAKDSYEQLVRNKNSKRFADSFKSDYDPNNPNHGPSEDLYGFNNYFRNYYLPEFAGIPYQTSNTMDTQMENMAATGTTTETGTATESVQTTEGTQTTDAATTSTPFEGDIVDYTSNNPKYFSYNGKLYNVPERFITKGDSNPKAQELLDLQNERRGTNFTLPEFTVQSLPEITKKAIAAQQDKEPANQNNPNVLAAQQAINILRAENPNDPKIDDIKRDLRLMLGVTNLDGLIS